MLLMFRTCLFRLLLLSRHYLFQNHLLFCSRSLCSLRQRKPLMFFHQMSQIY
ncbi:maltodextrin-binding protein mdxE [Listeria monocytogenes]|nr:maltodextrin-binding protein mdxE [Listeria monocytogenes]